MQRYCVKVAKHSAHYNFSDYRELVPDFLIVFENTFVTRANLTQVRFKCTFTIVNRQPSSAVGFVEFTDARVWQTDVYEGAYFNDFIKANLAEDILKRVTVNGMTGRSWLFRRCDRLCITVNSDQNRGISKQYTIFDIRWNLLKNRLELRDLMLTTVTRMSPAGGDEINLSDEGFIDDETNFEDQAPYKLFSRFGRCHARSPGNDQKTWRNRSRSTKFCSQLY